jgi:parallel beta-helix repeat protein
MAYPTGAVQLSSFIGTTGPLDPYATHLDYMGLGGHRAVATIAERNAIILQRRSFGMLVTVNDDPVQANNKTYMLANVKLGGVNDVITNNNNWIEFSTGSSFNFTGGPKSLYSDPTTGQITDSQYTTTRLLDSFTGNTFDEKLRYACLNADDGTIIDCTRYEGTTQTLSTTVDITKSIKLVFPAMTIQYTSASVTDHMFHIKKNNVFIEGTGRSSKLDQVVALSNTQFHMFTPVGATSNGGYHVTNINEDVATNQDGYNVITLIGFDCIGVEQVYNTSGAPSYNIVTTTYGVGGICITEGNPFVTGGGNAVNQIYIANIFVWKTRDHGILLLGAILAQIINCRVSRAAGHGFYLGGTATSITPSNPNVLTLGGSTSSYFLNCYASSGRLAGFCIHSSSYSQLQNCAAENFGMGYLLRSGFNISLFGCGAEENNPSDDVPVNMNISFQSFENGVLYTSKLNDIGGSELKDNYKGSSLYISGGRNLYIPNFFSTEPGGYNPGVDPGSSRTTHITILGNARAVYLTNPRLTGQSRVVNPIRIERSTQGDINSDKPRDVNLFFNPKDDRPDDGTTWYDSAPDFTFTRSGATGACTGIIMDQGTNTEVKNGSTYYTPWVYTPDSLYTPTTPYKALLASDTNNELFPITVSENIYIPVNSVINNASTYSTYSSIWGSDTDRDQISLIPTINGQTKRIIGLSITKLSVAPTGFNTLDIYLSTSTGGVVTDTLLYSVTSTTTIPVSVTLPNPISITGQNWCIKLVTTGLYTVTVDTVGLNTINY